MEAATAPSTARTIETIRRKLRSPKDQKGCLNVQRDPLTIQSTGMNEWGSPGSHTDRPDRICRKVSAVVPTDGCNLFVQCSARDPVDISPDDQAGGAAVAPETEGHDEPSRMGKNRFRHLDTGRCDGRGRMQFFTTATS